MNLLINIYYTGVNGSAKKFANEMIEKGIVDKIRKQSGNLKYDYYYDYIDSETILLIDKWESQESLDKHHESSIMGEIAKLREKYNLKMRIEKYIVNKDDNLKDDKYIVK